MLLDAPRSGAELWTGVCADDGHVTTAEGTRSRSPSQMLARLRPLLARIGITRVGDISWLSPLGFPVSQTCRPQLFAHHSIGQNTGAQGKGRLADQARVAAIMETLEAHSSEPRNVSLVRSNFARLRRAHVVLDPSSIRIGPDVEPAGADEPIMWTWATSLVDGASVLVPAETVFFPFFPADYRTRSIYDSSSNGLAAGGTYAEACLAGLYEVIERDYMAHWCRGSAVQVAALFEEEVCPLDVRRVAARYPEYQLQLYAVRIDGVANIPFLVCVLVGAGKLHYGFGCHLDVDVAAGRAVAEALQCLVTESSGSREDIGVAIHEGEPSPLVVAVSRLPGERTLRARDLRRTVVGSTGKGIKADLRRLLRWLRSRGHPICLAANLTRVGVEIPVVRVLVPGLSTFVYVKKGPDYGWLDAVRRSYCVA